MGHTTSCTEKGRGGNDTPLPFYSSVFLWQREEGWQRMVTTHTPFLFLFLPLSQREREKGLQRKGSYGGEVWVITREMVVWKGVLVTTPFCTERGWVGNDTPSLPLSLLLQRERERRCGKGNGHVERCMCHNLFVQRRGMVAMTHSPFLFLSFSHRDGGRERERERERER